MMRKGLLLIFTALACTSVASASVIGTWDAGVAVSDDTDGSGFTGTRYTLTLTSDEGVIEGIDMKVTASEYFYNETYRGTLVFKSGPPGNYDVDTCFLFLSGDVIAAAEGEDDVTPADPAWLKSSNLYSAFAFTSSDDYFDSAAVLQVVVPDGTSAPTLGDLYNTTDSNNVAYVEVDGELVTIVPEPATMCLLGLGGLAFLRRRRR